MTKISKQSKESHLTEGEGVILPKNVTMFPPKNPLHFYQPKERVKLFKIAELFENMIRLTIMVKDE